MATKTSQVSPADSRLRPDSLGTAGITFTVVSAAAPLTIVAGIAPLAISLGGVGAPSIYLIAGMILLVFAIGFMELTKHVSTLGGFYAYIARALGPTPGLGAGVLAVVSYNALQIGLYGILGVQAAALVHSLSGVEVAWWVYSLIGLVLIWILGFRGIEVGARVLAILLTAETCVILVIGGAVLLAGGADGIDFSSFAPENVFTPEIAAVLIVAFAAFTGFESTALYREEAKDPNRTVPRATYLSVLFMMLFYAFGVWILVLGAGSTRAVAVASNHTADMAFIISNQYVGAWGSLLLQVLIVTSIFAAQLAFHNTINRYTLSLSRDRVLPGRFARVHPVYRTPWFGGLMQSLLALAVVTAFALLNLDPYYQLLIWVNTPGVIGVIVLQALTSTAVVVYFLRKKGLHRPWYVVPSAVTALVAMAIVLALLAINIPILTGATEGPLNLILLAIVPAVFLLGVIAAKALKAAAPHIFEHIGGRERNE